MLEPVPPSIAAAYDPERFRGDGHRLVDMIADQLMRWHAGEGRVLPWQPPADARAHWAAQPLVAGAGELVSDLAQILAASTALAHPHCMAHQVAPPLPGAVLAETVAALLNNGMAIFEMGPAAVPIELAVIDCCAIELGYPDERRRRLHLGRVRSAT